MKKDFNQFTKSDLPLDSAINSSFSPTKNTTAKSKIKVVGEKKTGTRSATKPKTETATKTTTKSAVKSSALKSESAKTTTKTTSAKSATKTAEKSTKDVVKKNETQPQEKVGRAKTQLRSNVNIEDLEKANEESIKKYSFRNRRNRVIIIILSLLLVVSIIGIIAFIAVNKLTNNCHLYMHGNADAVYLIDGEEMDKFRTPSSIKGDRIYQFKLELKIESSGLYDCEFKVECYRGDLRLENTLIYELNSELFEVGSNGKYISKMPLSGNSTILVCYGIILDKAYETNLSVNNFKMEFHTTLRRV